MTAVSAVNGSVGTAKLFTSPAAEIEATRAYCALLGRWPVPFEERMAPTSLGDTHVIVSGPMGATNRPVARVLRHCARLVQERG